MLNINTRAHCTIPPTALWWEVVRARVFSEEEHPNPQTPNPAPNPKPQTSKVALQGALVLVARLALMYLRQYTKIAHLRQHT